MPYPDATVVIPAFNKFPLLHDCLISLEKYLDKRHRIVILDDCSNEENFEANARELIRCIPNASYERNSTNMGFPASCNRAVMRFTREHDDIGDKKNVIICF